MSELPLGIVSASIDSRRYFRGKNVQGSPYPSARTVRRRVGPYSGPWSRHVRQRLSKPSPVSDYSPYIVELFTAPFCRGVPGLVRPGSRCHQRTGSLHRPVLCGPSSGTSPHGLDLSVSPKASFPGKLGSGRRTICETCRPSGASRPQEGMSASPPFGRRNSMG
jgi:hypothetical protein